MQETDVHFVDIMGCENIKYNVQNMLAMHYIVGHELFILMSVWLLGVVVHCYCPASQRVSYCISLAQEKKLKFKVQF